MGSRKTNMVAGALLVFLALVAPNLAAQHVERSVQAILADIKAAQSVERVEQVDPDRVSDELLAELGEAVMDVALPNERQHEFMDQMMGGEGSSSLEAMHRSMGYSFLASGGTDTRRGLWGPGGWGMARPGGWGMMGPGMRGWGWPGAGFRGPLSAGLGVWIIVAVLSAAVVVLSILLATRRRP